MCKILVQKHHCNKMKTSLIFRSTINYVGLVVSHQGLIAIADHPQTNGLDERFNQILQRQLLKFVQEQSEWDQYLDSILFSYRVS